VSRQEATHAYAGYCPICGACNAASVDVPNDPEYAKNNAKFVSGLLRRGYRVERITIEEVRNILAFCDHRKKKKALRGRSQLDLGVA